MVRATPAKQGEDGIKSECRTSLFKRAQGLIDLEEYKFA
jgi:hypothetical protein